MRLETDGEKILLPTEDRDIALIQLQDDQLQIVDDYLAGEIEDLKFSDEEKLAYKTLGRVGGTNLRAMDEKLLHYRQNASMSLVSDVCFEHLLSQPWDDTYSGIISLAGYGAEEKSRKTGFPLQEMCGRIFNSDQKRLDYCYRSRDNMNYTLKQEQIQTESG